MNLTYKQQLALTVVIGLAFNILNTVFKHWVFSSIGKCLAGLLWIVHPVMMGNEVPVGRKRKIIQAAGVVLILWGIFGRLYLY